MPQFVEQFDRLLGVLPSEPSGISSRTRTGATPACSSASLTSRMMLGAASSAVETLTEIDSERALSWRAYQAASAHPSKSASASLL